MKKLIVLAVFLVAFCTVDASSKYSPFKGVWSSDSAEAVITDSICIFFFRLTAQCRQYLRFRLRAFQEKRSLCQMERSPRLLMWNRYQ